MGENSLRQLVWTDYRLALLFAVIAPLILLIWSLINKSEALTRLLIIYWRVASLLMITVYLMIPGWMFGYLSGLSARIFIPISLWFWVDINEEIGDLPYSRWKLSVKAWRWAMTLYCILGAIANSHFISCAFTPEKAATPDCQVWLEPPRIYKEIFHANSTPEFLGFLGMVGLVIYLLYLVYFLFIRLGKQGRSALEP